MAHNDSSVQELAGLVTALAQRFETLSEDIHALGERFKRQESALTDLSARVENLSTRVERQEARLSAIESFPRPPMSQPPRLYGTEAQSVSNPKRARAGYAG